MSPNHKSETSDGDVSGIEVVFNTLVHVGISYMYAGGSSSRVGSSYKYAKGQARLRPWSLKTKMAWQPLPQHPTPPDPTTQTQMS
jgi:hypothetical protein